MVGLSLLGSSRRHSLSAPEGEQDHCAAVLAPDALSNDSTAESVTPSGRANCNVAGASVESAVPVLTSSNGSWEYPFALTDAEVASSPVPSRNPRPVEVMNETFCGDSAAPSALAIGIP